jgi:hypothetical protein
VVTTVGVAFVPYEERGLDKWLMSFLKSMTMPTQMVWRKTYSPPAYFLSDYANIIKNEILTLTPAKSRNKLDDYLGQLSETETDLDKIEALRIQNIRMGFSTQAQSSVVLTQASKSSYSPSLGGTASVETEVIYAEEDTSPGRTISGGDTDNLPPVKREPLPEIKPEPKPVSTTTRPVQTPAPAPIQQTRQPQIQQRPQPQTIQQARPQARPSQIQLGQDQRPEERTAIVKEIIKDEVSSKKELLNSIEFKKPTLSAPSIDRAIINIPSNPRGEIKIRTTTKLPKIIVVQDIKEIETKESSLEKKVGELLDVTKQVRAEVQNAADKQAHMKQNKGRIEFFDTKYQELEKEQAKITSQITASTSQVQQIDAPEKTDLNKQVTDLSTKNEELKAQLAQIQAEIAMLKTGGLAQAQNQQAPDLGKPADQEKAIPPSKGPTAAGANLISGIVKNKNGELVENAVVIIKDKDGDAIRALKTNQLGQFKTQTAMQNGRYSVEVIKGGMKFDIIAVEARDEVISPLSIIAFE